MTLRTLQISTLEDSGLARLQQLEPSIDGAVYGSQITNLVRSVAYAIHPVTWLVADLYEDAFPQSAKGEALDKNFGAMEDLPRKPASSSVGHVLVYGAAGFSVPIFTEFSAPDGVQIRTSETGIISAHEIVITGSVNSDGLVTFSAENELPKGSSVEILTGNALVDGAREIVGSTQSTFTIKIQDKNTLNVTGSASATYAKIKAESKSQGAYQNISGAAVLSGDYEAYTTLSGMSGAADAESDTRYSARIIKARGALEGVFTDAQVELAALSVPGNTRAWCVTPLSGVSGGAEGEVGYKPTPGQVCVYVLRDDDADTRPDQAELDMTKQAIIAKGKLPCHTVPGDIFVFAPNLIQANVKISNLVPSTPEMRSAIESEMAAYFEDIVDFEETVTKQQLTAAIGSVRDAANKRVISFEIVNQDFDPGPGGMLVFGGVSWL